MRGSGYAGQLWQNVAIIHRLPSGVHRRSLTPLTAEHI